MLRWRRSSEPDSLRRTATPFTPRVRKVLELSFKEAMELGHNYIGTEHLLLGLIREGEGMAPQVLHKLTGDLGKVRAEVLKFLEPIEQDGRREGVMQWLREGYPIAKAVESFGIPLEDFRKRVEEIMKEQEKRKEPPEAQSAS